jgi:hypothetical protein
MRRLLRMVNAAFWLTFLLFVAISYNSFGDAPRLMGEAVVVAVLWLVCDLVLRPKRRRISN